MNQLKSAVVGIVLLGTHAGHGLLAQKPSVSFLNTIAVGDSYTAGVQNGVLKSDGQQSGYAAVAARQVRTFLFQPLIPEPGFGSEVMLVDGQLVVGPQTTSGRTFPLVIPQNLGVPAQGVVEALTVRPALPLDTLEDVILGLPILVVPLGLPAASQIELAVGLQPTFTFFWLGLNDVLAKAVLDLEPIPFPVFQEAYIQAMGALLTLTETRMVVANIPDVTVIPYLTSAEEIAAGAGAPLELIGPLLGIGPGDFVRLPAIPLVQAILGQQVAGPLPEGSVLQAAEVVELKTITAQINGLIAGLAAQFGVPVVDMHAAFNRADQEGITVGDLTLTTDFLGGFFSLDGSHPTDTGNAFIANLFLETINQSFATPGPIELVDLEMVAAGDSLVPSSSPAPDGLRVLAGSSPEHLQGLTCLLGKVQSSAGRGLDPGDDPREQDRHTMADWALMLERLQYFSAAGLRPGPVSAVHPWSQLQQERAHETLGRSRQN